MKLNNYEKLESIFRHYYYLKRTFSLISWDSAVYMPAESVNIRSNQFSSQMFVMNKLLLSKKTFRLLDLAKENLTHLNSWQIANIREINEILKLKKAIPVKLEEKIIATRMHCEYAWEKSRKLNDYSFFEKQFSSMLKLIRNKADYLSNTYGISPYEGLMQEFDYGAQLTDFKDIFSALKISLPALIVKIKDKQSKNTEKINISLSKEKQIQLFKKILSDFSFDFKYGRFDLSTHPFTEGGYQDIRLTTKIHEHDFLSGLLGVIHECGHALYDMNLPKEYFDQPVGYDRGMSIHEGIALYFEMILTRSSKFSEYLSEVLNSLDIKIDPKLLFNQFLKINPKACRIDADEVSYLLHIILRHEMETMLLDCQINVRDIPHVWNEKTKQYFGYIPSTLSLGCLQDIHWAVGLFGYFPSYAKGFIFSLSLLNKFGGFEGIDQFEQIIENLKTNIFFKGSYLENRVLLDSLVGSENISNEILRYLSKKYLH